MGLTTLQRWRRQFAGDGDGVDRRKGSCRNVAHRLSEEERQRILLPCNEPEFPALPPGQIVPVLAVNAPEAQILVDRWRWEYNSFRPHLALQGLTPLEATQQGAAA